MTQTFGFNVIGYVSGNLGLGVHARSIANLLEKKQLPFAIHDLDPELDRGGFDASFNRYEVKNFHDLPFDINLYLVPPPTLEWLISEGALFGAVDQRMNVAYPMWELTKMPKRWESMLMLFDVLVAGSEFTRATFETSVSGPFILFAQHPISLPNRIIPCRQQFDLPDDKVIFISSFDPAGDPERKNPWAVIAAFLRAAANDDRAYLIIKVNNAVHEGRFHDVVGSLEKTRDNHPRIRIMTERLSYDDTLALYASCDVFVSLHRSEGLGLGLMEAMALGKPVIATAWSGNMSYMNHTNSCLVDYQLVPVKGSLRYYDRDYLGVDTVWAEPRVETAAAWIRKLTNDPELRLSIGARANADMRQYQESANRGCFIDEIEAIWKRRSILTINGSKKQSDVKRVQNEIHNHYLSPSKRALMHLRRTLDQQLLWRFQQRR